MVAFYLSQDENEFFWRYFTRLNNFIAQYGYYLEKREILNVIKEEVNGGT